MLNFLKTKATAGLRLAEVDNKIAAVQTAQAKRDDRQKALQREAELIAVDVASGEGDAVARAIEIEAETASLSREIAVGARVLAELGDAQVDARRTVADEKQALRQAEAVKVAKVRLKALPGQLDELRRLEVRAAEIMSDVGACGGVFPGIYFNLEAIEREAREHMEYCATPGADHPLVRRQKQAREAEARAIREEKERLAAPLKFDIDAAMRRATPEELERARLWQSAREGERRSY